MKYNLLLTMLMLTVISNAQVFIKPVAGMSNKGVFTARVEVGYDIDKVSLSVGGTRDMRDEVYPSYIYLKGGYAIGQGDVTVTPSLGFSMAYNNREVWRGTIPIYSHYETVWRGRHVLSVEVMQKCFSHSSWGLDITNIGDNLFASIVFKYKFGQDN